MIRRLQAQRAMTGDRTGAEAAADAKAAVAVKVALLDGETRAEIERGHLNRLRGSRNLQKRNRPRLRWSCC
jgi:tellurite resistance protein